ncbi:glycosyltransferase [Shewanella sp.]|uniref:glycosyltransferase n=1 Tax=Shewanella sp. TaxID=50422 RepID=UPI003A97AA39
MGRRIAIAIDSLAGGGAEKVMLTLAEGLMAQGHQVHMLVMEPFVQHKLPKGLQVTHCFKNAKNLDSFWRYRTAAKQLKAKVADIEAQDGRFDLFISNLHQTNLLMIEAGVAPLYCVLHNSPSQELKRQRALGLFSWLDMRRAIKALNGQQLVTVSEGIAEEVRHSSLVTPKSVTTIYNPFDFSAIEQLAAEQNVAIPEQDFIIHVGRVARQKRHDVLFAALAKLTHKLPLVLLCGNTKKARKLARKADVAEQLLLPGFQQNPYPWIKRAKLLVLSSDYEGLPTVLIEALALGTPVVSTDCHHGPSEILTGDLARYLVPVGDADGLAVTIDSALSEPPSSLAVDILAKTQQHQVVQAYLALGLQQHKDIL